MIKNYSISLSKALTEVQETANPFRDDLDRSGHFLKKTAVQHILRKLVIVVLVRELHTKTPHDQVGAILAR